MWKTNRFTMGCDLENRIDSTRSSTGQRLEDVPITMSRTRDSQVTFNAVRTQCLRPGGCSIDNDFRVELK